MNISDITSSLKATSLLNARTSASSSTSSTSSTSLDPMTRAFDQAGKRVQSQLDSTSTQLSSFGKLKSAFADVQTTAQALSKPKTGATDADISKSASDFVAAFNVALKAAQSSQSQASSVKEDTSARRTQTDLRQVLGKDNSLSTSLKQIGITQQADGSLALDTSKFQAASQADPTALRATVAKLGQQSQAVASRELSDTGNVGGTLKALDTRSRQLQTQQTNQQTVLASLQQNASTLSKQFGSSASNGVNAYSSIYSYLS